MGPITVRFVGVTSSLARGEVSSDPLTNSFREAEVRKTGQTDVEAEKEVAVSGRRAFTPTNYDSRRCYAPLKALSPRRHRC